MCVEMLMLLLLVRHHGLCRRRRRSHHASIVSIRILEEELRWQEPSCSTRHIWVAASPCNHDDSSTVS